MQIMIKTKKCLPNNGNMRENVNCFYFVSLLCCLLITITIDIFPLHA